MEKGYTIPELIVVLVVLGLVSFMAINKASYAFVTEEPNDETTKLILVKCATEYANSIKEELKGEKSRFVSSNDLITAGYLIDEGDYKNFTLELTYDEASDAVLARIIE